MRNLRKIWGSEFLGLDDEPIFLAGPYELFRKEYNAYTRDPRESPELQSGSAR